MWSSVRLGALVTMLVPGSTWQWLPCGLLAAWRAAGRPGTPRNVMKRLRDKGDVKPTGKAANMHEQKFVVTAKGQKRVRNAKALEAAETQRFKAIARKAILCTVRRTQVAAKSAK